MELHKSRSVLYSMLYSCNSLMLEFYANVSKITFIDHHLGPPSLHPLRRGNKPDVLAVKEDVFTRWIEKTSKQQLLTSTKSVYSQFPWHLVESVVEIKAHKDTSKAQIMAYGAGLRQACPKYSGVYALTVRPQDYNILWDDPAGPIISLSIPWSQSDLFVSYVNSLYCLCFEHTIDHSINLRAGSI